MRFVRSFLLVAPVLLGSATSVHAEDAARPAWAADLEALRAEVEPLKARERTTALLAKQPEPAALLAELTRPHPYKPDAKTGMTHWTRDVEGVGSLTVFAYVPTGYTPEKAWPAMLWLHGGVSRDEDGGGLSGLGMLRDECEAKGVLLVSPSGKAGCTWWDPKGVEHAVASLRELATVYRVDPTRTTVAGFSDGASGGLHMLAHAPDAFGCVISLMGNPLVTRTAGGPSFVPNQASIPVFAFNGGKDGLYPSERMKPLFEEMQKVGGRITWEDLPEAGHNPGDLGARSDDIWPFWAKSPRVALPARVDWETALPAAYGRRAWVEILEVAADAASSPGLDAAPLAVSVPARPRLGIRLDTSHAGPGLKVEAVEPGTPAEQAGLKAGDVLVKAGETVLPAGREAFDAFQAYLRTLTDADGAFEVERGSDRVKLAMRPRVLKQDDPPAALGFGRPSGRVVAEVKAPDRIEVTTRGVKRLRLHLAPALIPTGAPLTVVLNGREAWKGTPKPEAAYILEQARRSLPGDPVFEAEVTLDVPAKQGADK